MLVSLTPNYCLGFLIFVILCHLHIFLRQPISNLFFQSDISHGAQLSFSCLQSMILIFHMNTACHSVCTYFQHRKRTVSLEWKLLAAITIISTFVVPQRMLLSSENPLLQPYQILWSAVLLFFGYFCQKVIKKGYSKDPFQCSVPIHLKGWHCSLSRC